MNVAIQRRVRGKAERLESKVKEVVFCKGLANVARYATPVSDVSDPGGVSCFCVCVCMCDGRGEADIIPSSEEGVVIVAILGSARLELQQTFLWNFTSQGLCHFLLYTHTHTCLDTVSLTDFHILTPTYCKH